MNDRAPLRIALATTVLATLFSACNTPPAEEEAVAAPAAPFEGIRDVVSENGTSIRYEARGAGAPTLVFLHGWCGNRGTWREQVTQFAAGQRVVTLDLGGHGDSGMNREDWSVPSFVQDVEAVIADLDLHDVILVAHSTAAGVALEVAAAQRWRVIGVVGVDALHDVSLPWDEDALRASVESIRRDFPGFIERFVRNQCAPDVDPELIARLNREMAANDVHIALRVLRGFTQADNEAALDRCPAPVLCINAEGLGATNVLENQRHSTTFSAVVLEDAGHFLMLERPDEFNRELERAVATILQLRDRS